MQFLRREKLTTTVAIKLRRPALAGAGGVLGLAKGPGRGGRTDNDAAPVQDERSEAEVMHVKLRV
jgi:hypothetical protein